MAYISKIKVPGVEAAYMIKDSEGRLMIAPAYDSSKTYSVGDYYVKESTDGTPVKLYVIDSSGNANETTVGAELKSIKQSIARPMNYIGVTSTHLKDGDTTDSLVPQSEGSLIKISGFVAGDVVLAPAPTGAAEKYYEYVWNGSQWSEFGSTKALGKMAYADKASGSTDILYKDTKYTGGTVEVNEYSEGASKYLKRDTVVSTVNVSNTTSASSVSKTASKLATTSVSVVDGTGAAVTNISTTQKGLATTSIFGVKEDTVEVSKVENGTTSVQVGATNTTSVISGLGSTASDASAGYNNPFVGATVGGDECLSWIEKPLINTDIREAVATEISVPKAKITNFTGIAKKADNETTVATGELSDKGSGIITDVTSTTEEFAKKAASNVVVATGSLGDTGPGADVIADITITEVKGLVTGITYTENNGVLVEGTSGETGAIKVLTGINTGATTKQVTLTEDANKNETVNVAITVNPVGPTVSQP